LKRALSRRKTDGAGRLALAAGPGYVPAWSAIVDVKAAWLSLKRDSPSAKSTQQQMT